MAAPNLFGSLFDPLPLPPAPPLAVASAVPVPQLPPPPEPAPEVDPGFLASLRDTAMSGLATVGNFLDLPGSMVRDVLAWENPVDQLLTPFSSENRNTGRDVLTKWGVTAPNDPDKWEAADFLGFGAEVLTDPLTFLSLGGSAVGKGGMVAKNAGLMDDLLKTAPASVGTAEARTTSTLADLLKPRATDAAGDAFGRARSAVRSARELGIDDLRPLMDEPLGGLASFKVPFTSMDPIVLGTGETGQKIAKGLDTVGRTIHDARIPGTDLAPIASFDALMNPNIGQADTAMGRRVMRDVTAGRRAAEETARGQFTDALEPLVRQGGKLADDSMESNRALRRVFEGIDIPQNIGVEKANEVVRTVLDPMVPLADEYGINLSDLADSVVKYFPRRMTKSLRKDKNRSGKIVSAQDEGELNRLSFLRGLGEGTDTIHQLAADPVLRKMLDEKAGQSAIVDFLGTNYGSQIPKQYIEPIQIGGRVSPPPGSTAIVNAAKEAGAEATRLESEAATLFAANDPIAQGMRTQADNARMAADQKLAELRSAMKSGAAATGPGGRGSTFNIKDRHEAIARWLESLDDEVLESGVYGNHPLQDLLGRTITFNQAIQTAKRTLDNLADDSVLKEARRLSRSKETTTLGDLLQTIGLKTNYGLDESGSVVGGYALRKWLELRGQDVTLDTLKAARDLPLPKDFADNIARIDQAFKGPEPVGPIIKALDDFTGLFKVGVLTWPARYVRDLVSGQFQNWAGGQWSAQSLKDAHRVLTGKGAENLASIPIVREELRRARLPPSAENAADMLRKLAYRFKIVSQYEPISLPTNAAMPQGSTIGDAFKQMPGSTFAGAGEPFNPGRQIIDKAKGGYGTAGTTLNPLKAEYRGVREGVENTFAPAAAGDVAGHYTDGLNRLSPFIELLRRGVHPKEAARQVRASQIDYSAGTRFSREVVGRAFPFAKFSLGAVPYTLSQLYEKPGGKLAQTIRASSSASARDAGTPDHIAETLSIPLGTNEDGSRRYINGLGLMHEDPLSFVGGGVRGGMVEALSRLNPIAKAPLEWATGESFFQRGPTGGRELSSMDPTVGRTLANVVGREDPITFPGSDALEFVLGNSPISRLLTTARTATDPRKGPLAKLSVLGTGIRIADVSPAAQDAVLRERVQQLQRELGARDFTTVSLNEERIAQLPPEDQAKFRELKATIDTLTKRAKERKAARALAAE